MKKIFLFLIVILTGCSADVTRNVNILELEYPNDLKVIKRAEWGWQPFENIIDEHQIEKITIHHGGEEFSETRDVQEYLRSLQSWSRRDKNWIDIPYHFVIDYKGNIYEARPINYPGDTNTEYNPKGHALIEVIGNYENRILNETQLNSIVDLCAYLSQKFNVPAEDIKGHKDYSNKTVCPGKDLYKYLEDGTIVNKVKWKIEQ